MDFLLILTGEIELIYVQLWPYLEFSGNFRENFRFLLNSDILIMLPLTLGPSPLKWLVSV